MKSRNHIRNTRRSPLLWLIPTQIAAVTGAISVATGGVLLRTAMLGAVLWAMLVPLLLSLEAGLTAVLIFEPFHGLLRRAQYVFVPYSQNEPIHLLAPIVTLCAFLMILFRHKLETIRLTPLASLTTVLALICFMQIFNPLQGGLFVGFSGALFYLVPMAWFYFGQTVRADFVPKILRLIVLLALITSLYGVYQLVFGYPYFELYWIENTDLYTSIAVYNVQRALATFNNAEEWGRYIQIGCIIALGLGMSRAEEKKRMLWFLCAGSLFVMLAFTGQRTSIFGLILAAAILFLTGAKSVQNALARLMMLIVPVLLVAALSKPISDDDGYSLDDGDRVGAMLTHTTKGTIDPTGEGSLYARFDTWTRLITVDIPASPVGIGLGAATVSASRESTGSGVAIDNHFLSLAWSVGVPGALILLWIMMRACLFCWRGWRFSEIDSREANTWRIMLALMANLILTNFFGTSFTIYSIAPLGWLFIGWISARHAELETAEPTYSSLEVIDKTTGWNNVKNVSY